jgi:hypothetical protein
MRELVYNIICHTWVNFGQIFCVWEINSVNPSSKLKTQQIPDSTETIPYPINFGMCWKYILYKDILLWTLAKLIKLK